MECEATRLLQPETWRLEGVGIAKVKSRFPGTHLLSFRKKREIHCAKPKCLNFCFDDFPPAALDTRLAVFEIFTPSQAIPPPSLHFHRHLNLCSGHAGRACAGERR